jgi:hypothetical protein
MKMQIAKNLMIVFVAAFVLMATDAIAEDTVYRWVDDQGVVHFGDRPNDAANAEKLEIQSTETTSPAPGSDVERDDIYAQPEGPSRAQQQREARAESRAEAAVLADAIAAGCDQRRQIVSQLEPSTRVMVRGEDGEVYRLDDNERLKALDEAKAYIAEKCDNN